MKKIISVLLIVAMMAATFAMVFAGTVTAVAEGAEASVTAKYVSNDNDAGSIGSRIAGFFALIFDVLFHRSNNPGLFSVIIDGIYNAFDNRFDISGFMEGLNASGFIEWFNHTFFPR